VSPLYILFKFFPFIASKVDRNFWLTSYLGFIVFIHTVHVYKTFAMKRIKSFGTSHFVRVMEITNARSASQA